MTKKTMKHIGYGFLAVGLLVIATGCKNSDGETARRGEIEFSPEDDNRPVRQFTDTQAAAGARADGMLRGHHFDGARLNSLGTQKLDAMLRDDDACSPLTVYMDVPTDGDFATGRRDAVSAYLKFHGLKDDQIALKDGPNPASHSPAAYHISRYGKTESGDAGESGAAQTSTAGEK